MIGRLRRVVVGSSPAARAGYALAAYQADTRHGLAIAALLGNLQVAHSKQVLTDGPERLAVVTAESICLVHPSNGQIDRATPLADLAAYVIDETGRFIVRFDSHDELSRVAGFRPVAGPDRTLTTCQAAERFIRRVIEAWQEGTGRTFVNTWSAAAFRSTDQAAPPSPAEPNST